MDTIKVKTVQDITEAYKTFGVSEKRIAGLESKFTVIPDQFKVVGLTSRKVEIAKKEVIVPEFSVMVGKVANSIPVGQLFAKHVGDNPKASEITKADSEYKGRFLVSNSKSVNPFAEGLSEAEFVLACQGKEFKAEPAKDFRVYSGFVEQPDKTNKLEFHASPEEAVSAIGTKSYRTVTML